MSGRRVVQREWVIGNLPAQEMPSSVLKPRGMQGCVHDVNFFMKMFGNNISLLTTESNKFRVE